MNYFDTIKIALLFFPFIAIIISVPFILIQYHKYGSISFLKSLIIYSFVLYFICAYFLIILPLPNKDVVANLTTPRVQLIPFKFIMDFINQTSFNIAIPTTYITSLKESYFYVPIYNLFLTLPFGIYLRYYFKTDIKKTILYTFLLSLFFELTQLTGLYFIYPRGYRLFDIDDLMLNTLGGLFGYLISPLIIKFLPPKDELNDEARIKGRNISGLRRLTSLLLDLFIFIIINSIVCFIFNSYINYKYISYIMIFIYYVLYPYLKGGSTLAEKYLNLRIVDNNEKNNLIRLFLRRFIFIIIYFAGPILLITLIYLSNIIDTYRVLISILLAIIIFLIYFISFIKYTFTNKTMLYEKISKTKMISTIDVR